MALLRAAWPLFYASALVYLHDIFTLSGAETAGIESGPHPLFVC